MFGKFLKYFFLDKNGRTAWDEMRTAKNTRKNNINKGVTSKKGIPILNTPFGAKPGSSGIIFPDSNPEEQISLIEMAIGEAKKIEAEPQRQLPPPDPNDPTRLKKKMISTADTSPVSKNMIDMEVGEGVPKENTYSTKHSDRKIEVIYEAMKIFHAKQDALAGLDDDARKKLRLMANTMMGNKQ